MKERMAARKSSVPSVPVASTTPITQPKVSADTKEKIDNADPPAGYVRKFPPDKLHGGQLKQWYKQMLNGGIPANWEQRPGIITKAKKGLETETSAVVLDKSAAPKVESKAAPAQAPAAPTEPKPAPFDLETHVKKFNLPNATQHFVKQCGIALSLLDTNSKNIPDPKVLMAENDKVPSAAKLLAKDNFDISKWTYEAILELCRKAPEFTAILLRDIRNSNLSIREKLDNLENKVAAMEERRGKKAA